MGLGPVASSGDDSRGHELAVALRTAYMALHRDTEAALAQHDVTADQFVVLVALAEGEAGTQRELVARTASDPSTLRAMLVLLESRRLIERRPHPTDGRARSVRLTGMGRRILNRTWKATQPVRLGLVAALHPTEVERLKASLKVVAEVMGRSVASEGTRRAPRRALTEPPKKGL